MDTQLPEEHAYCANGERSKSFNKLLVVKVLRLHLTPISKGVAVRRELDW